LDRKDLHVDRIFGDGELAPLLSLRVRLERSIRAQCSEHVILQVHDAIYAPVKAATAQVHDAMSAALGDVFGVDPSVAERSGHRRSIVALRRLLDDGAKERELQDGLVSSGLLTATCKVAQEVSLQATDDHRGMRMDIVLEPKSGEPTQIVELKRGSHLLLARRGKPTERLSRGLVAALKQLQGYGDRLETDAAAVARIEEGQGLKICNPELRLIAGRRLPDDHAYHLLSSAESDGDTPGLQLQIYTWDAFLAELERILD
jgi:hypothetical protein